MNPFFQEWTTDFGLPPFEEIKTEHFEEALNKGFEQHRSAVKSIINDEREPGFSSVIEALELSSELVEKVANVTALSAHLPVGPNVRSPLP